MKMLAEGVINTFSRIIRFILIVIMIGFMVSGIKSVLNVVKRFSL